VKRTYPTLALAVFALIVLLTIRSQLKKEVPVANEPDAQKQTLNGQDGPSENLGDVHQRATNGANDLLEFPVPEPASSEIEEAKTPLIRGIQQALQNNVLIQDKTSLQATLLQADAELDRIKRSNREALKNLSRQVRRPNGRDTNIILILADDLSYNDLSCYGQTAFQTPELDRMATEGVRFTNFYAGSPDESTSQITLLTGRNAGRIDDSSKLSPSQFTMAKMLWTANYQTGFVGRWVLNSAESGTSPNSYGFEEWFGIYSDERINNHYPEFLYSNSSRLRLPANGNNQQGQLAHDVYTQETLAFLDKQKRGKPFFLMVSFHLPNIPIHIPNDKNQKALEALSKAQQKRASSMQYLDRSIGQIVSRLKKLNLDRRTALFFTGDNGPARQLVSTTSATNENSQTLKNRAGELYEGSLRIPLIARGPGLIQAGQICNNPAAMWDLLPTFASIATANRKPRQLDGISLISILKKNNAETKRDALYWRLAGQNGIAQAMRRGEWKVVVPAGSASLDAIELYNISTDPAETQNVAKQHPEVVQSFLKKNSI